MGVHEKPIYSGELPKKDGGLREFADLEGGLTKKEGVMFLRGVDTQMHTMIGCTCTRMEYYHVNWTSIIYRKGAIQRTEIKRPFLAVYY